MMAQKKKPQVSKFIDLARELGTHEEEERFVEALRQVSKGKVDLAGSEAAPEKQGRRLGREFKRTMELKSTKSEHF